MMNDNMMARPTSPLFATAKHMIIKAKIKHGLDIAPCVYKKNLGECFNVFKGKIHFWFNDSEGSTRMISAPVPSDVTVYTSGDHDVHPLDVHCE